MPYPIAGECFCEECLAELRARGDDPLDRPAQRHHKQELEAKFLERLYKTVQAARPGVRGAASPALWDDRAARYAKLD